MTAANPRPGRHHDLLTVLRPHLHQAYSDAERRRHPTPRLTSRQQELLPLLAAGHTNTQIARRLGISEGTVRSHLETSTACCKSPAGPPPSPAPSLNANVQNEFFSQNDVGHVRKVRLAPRTLSKKGVLHAVGQRVLGGEAAPVIRHVAGPVALYPPLADSAPDAAVQHVRAPPEITTIIGRAQVARFFATVSAAAAITGFPIPDLFDRFGLPAHVTDTARAKMIL